MTDFLNIPFAIILFITVSWTTLFSFSNNQGVRGIRNFGILGGYLSGIVFIFIAGWKQALFTWIFFGIIGGIVYTLWEILQRIKTLDGEERPSVRLTHIFPSLAIWPIMIPEAVEYSLAEFGYLKNMQGDGAETKAAAEQSNSVDAKKPRG